MYRIFVKSRVLEFFEAVIERKEKKRKERKKQRSQPREAQYSLQMKHSLVQDMNQRFACAESSKKYQSAVVAGLVDSASYSFPELADKNTARCPLDGNGDFYRFFGLYGSEKVPLHGQVLWFLTRL